MPQTENWEKEGNVEKWKKKEEEMHLWKVPREEDQWGVAGVGEAERQLQPKYEPFAKGEN